MPPGAGLFTLLAMLLLAPFQLWQEQAQKRRLLSPHELNLRRATQPLGVAAVLLWVASLHGARDIGGVLADLAARIPDKGPVAVVVGAVLLCGLASFVIGLRGCWGARSDRMLPAWAFFKCAAGVGGLVLLRRNAGGWMDGGDIWMSLLWLALNSAAVWCATVGAARFLLLTVGGGDALRIAGRIRKQRNAPMRPAKRW